VISMSRWSTTVGSASPFEDIHPVATASPHAKGWRSTWSWCTRTRWSVRRPKGRLARPRRQADLDRRPSGDERHRTRPG
jgi:hypothetical protein